MPLESWRDSDRTRTDTHQDNGAGEPQVPKFPPPVRIDDFVEQYPDLRPAIIGDPNGSVGLLRQGETMNVIAPSKVGKSWLVLDMAFAIATGRDWFGHETTPGRVLIVDNELHQETLAHRIKAVMQAREIEPHEIANISVLSLRGELCDLYGLADRIGNAGQVDVVVLDAFYRFFPKGIEENSNSDIAGMYNELDRLASVFGVAFVIVHHSTKGDQGGKELTDVGSGGGAMGRACDCHVIFRRHAEDGCVTLEAVTRSWRAPDKRVLRWGFPLWTLDDSLDPDDLKSSRGRPAIGGSHAPGVRNGSLTPADFVAQYFDDPGGRSLVSVTEDARADGVAVSRTRSLVSAAISEKILWPKKINGIIGFTADFAQRDLSDQEIADQIRGTAFTARTIKATYGVANRRAANIAELASNQP